MAAEGAQATSQRAAGLGFAFLDNAAGFEGRVAQLLQLLLRGVVGSLQGLGPPGSMPQGSAQAWKQQDDKKSERGKLTL
jgi:hypothetical protein